MDYKKLIKALTCSCAEDEPDNLGCKNRKCKYRDADGACNVVSMCEDAAIAIEKLIAKVETAEKCISAIEDDLDRGNDNDWARQHISEYRG